MDYETIIIGYLRTKREYLFKKIKSKPQLRPFIFGVTNYNIVRIETIDE